MTTEPLADVVGRNCARLRVEAGLTQEQFVRYAREVGLRWTASKVADFERGRREVAFGTVLAVSRALSLARGAAEERGTAPAGGSVLLADLLMSDGNLVLTGDGPWPLATVVAAVCSGKPWPTDLTQLLGVEGMDMQRTYEKIVAGALSKALVDGVLDPSLTAADLEAMRHRSGLAENRLAQRLKVSRDKLAALSFRLWDGRTFAEERDQRAGDDANSQKRARVSRELRAQLEEELANGG
jgi:DNA-binding transcriptional regulator YiaG